MSRAETSRPTYERLSPTTLMSTSTTSVERLLISCFPSLSDTERSHVAVPSPVCSHQKESMHELIGRIQRGGAIEAQELGRDRLQPSTCPGYVLSAIKQRYKSLQLGFIVVDYLKDAQKAAAELTSWIETGKIQAKDSEQVVDTKFEDIPKTWHMLFDGGNKGKLITKLV